MNGVQKPSPATPITPPDKPPDVSMQVPAFSPRGHFNVGDEVSIYGNTVKVVGLRPDGQPIYGAVPGTSTTSNKPLAPQAKPQIRRGQWLRNRMLELYNDPMYKNASPDVKQYYKEKAYDKWVVPYYKHIGMTPQTKEQFVTGVPEHESGLQSFFNYLTLSGQKYAQAREVRAQRRETILESAAERSSKFLAGVSSFLNWATTSAQETLTGRPVKQTGQEPFKVAENYYNQQAQHLDDILEDRHAKGLTSTITDLATQGIFFEASGGAKAAEMFKFANPRTATLGLKMAKTAWNGAVTGMFWAPTTGGKPSDISGDVAGFALLDVGLKASTAAFYKTMGKFFNSEFVNKILESTATKLASGKGVEIPKEAEFAKGGDVVNQQAAEAGAARVLNEAAQKVNGGSEKGAFKRMSPRKQKALLLRLSLVAEKAKEMNLDEKQELEATHLSEQEDKNKSVVPVAAKVQEKVDGIIKEAGLEPTQAKLGATLPHHNTTIDSPLQHISARIAWLQNRLKSHVREDLIMSDVETIKEALRQEKQLYKQAKILQEIREGKRTVSGGSGREEPMSPEHMAAHQDAFEQARREWQEANPGKDYASNMSALSSIMKRAEEIRKGVPAKSTIHVPPERRFMRRGKPVVTEMLPKTKQTIEDMSRAEKVKLEGR